MAGTVTCGDWLTLETKAELKNSLAPLKVFIFHNTTGAGSWTASTPTATRLQLTLIHNVTFLCFNPSMRKHYHCFQVLRCLHCIRPAIFKHKRQRKPTSWVTYLKPLESAEKRQYQEKPLWELTQSLYLLYLSSTGISQGVWKPHTGIVLALVLTPVIILYLLCLQSVSPWVVWV